MGRYPQEAGSKGSLFWIQKLVNDYPQVLNQSIGEKVDWYSPLKKDEYAEYRDSTFIDLLNIDLSKVQLDDFWPNNGPQWDALGKASNGTIILVEAKSHLNENKSRCQASSPVSLRLIHHSLENMANAFGVNKNKSWLNRYYQYTNRLAHAYFLKELNSIPTTLFFLHFVNDKAMNGPRTVGEWKEGISMLHQELGIENKIPEYVKSVFIDVSNFR
jgi:hypothetical protein